MRPIRRLRLATHDGGRRVGRGGKAVAGLVVAALVAVAVNVATQDHVPASQVDQETLDNSRKIMSELARVAPPKSTEPHIYWDPGWGPKRQVFTIAEPAPYAAFNSITDNPNIGDERNFVGVRLRDDEQVWHKAISADPGDEAVVRVFVHNACADNLGVEPGDSGCWLQGVTVRLEQYEADGRTSFAGILDAVNAKAVYDGVEIRTGRGAKVAVIPGSLQLESNAHQGLAVDAKKAFGSGVPLGYEQMDGVIKPGYQFALYVSFRVRVSGGER